MKMKLTYIPVLLLGASALGCGAPNAATIQASGQIEATQISVAPELSGQVVEVFVREGDAVHAGDALLRLDDSLLRSQKEAAQSELDSAKAGVHAAQEALDTAKAQLQVTRESELAQDQANRLHDWFVRDPKSEGPDGTVSGQTRITHPPASGEGGCRQQKTLEPKGARVEMFSNRPTHL